MEKKKLFLLIIGILLIVVPFFLNFYSIYKLILVLIGIIIVDIYYATKKKVNIFLIIYLPLILLILTYSVDYIKSYTLNLSPIFVLENKVNEHVSLYNSVFYRIYKCDNEFIFDNEYKKSFACNPNLITDMDINRVLRDPKESYKLYKNDFIKITGKISKISGNSQIELKEYTNKDSSVNGYVQFNKNSNLIIKLNDVNLTNYKIYDYITVVGLLKSYDKKTNTLTLTDAKLEEKNLYSEYHMEVIESAKCENTIKEYADKIYTKCISNIYLDYGVDKYELSYALKDGKITFDDLLSKASKEIKENKIIYELDKFNVISCNREKNIILSKDEKKDYSLCDE